VLQKFCKRAILIEQVIIPYFETGGAALEFPMLSVVLSTREMVETIYFYEFVAALKCPDSTEEELGLTDVSKGKLKESIETILLLGAVLGKNIVVL